MQIILLDPPNLLPNNRLQEVTNAPLSACLMSGYISSLLKKHGFEVKIIDANSNNLSLHEIIKLIQSEPPILLGVHLVYQWEETLKILEMLEIIKINCATHISLYGYYPTFAYKEIINNNIYVDTIVIGEPEHTFLELAKILINNRPYKEMLSIKGLSFAKCQEVVKNEDRELIVDLDNLPFPERTGSRNDFPEYILGSRGCYNHCNFCYLHSFYGQGSSWRGRSVENIAKEIEELTKEGYDYFYFADANFFERNLEEKKKRGLKLASLLKALDKNIKFGLECRADDVEREVFQKLKEVGLREVFLGLENGCQKVLRRFKKNINITQNEEAVRTIQDLGINLFLGFIIFDPETTIDDLRENLSFLKKLNLLSKPSITGHLLCHRQSIFHGTPAYQELLLEERLSFPNYSKYEGIYKFTDSRVDFIYEVVEGFCQKVLNTLQGKDLKNSANNLKEKAYKEINEFLISNFEETVSFFEKHENCNREGVYYLKEEISSRLPLNQRISFKSQRIL